MFSFPAALKISFLSAKNAHILGQSAEGWRIGRGSHEAQLADKHIRQGSNGYKTDQIINQTILIRLLGSLLYGFKSLGLMESKYFGLRWVKYGIFLGAPLLLPVFIAFVLTLKRDEKSSIFTILEQYKFYNNHFKKHFDRLKDMWVMKKLHLLLTHSRVQKMFKWLEDNISYIIKLSIAALIIPIFMSGQIYIASAIIAAITLSYLAEAKYLPQSLASLIQKISYPIGIIAGLFISDPFTRLFTILELGSMIIVPYRKYAVNKGVTKSSKDMLDDVIKEAFASKNKSITKFSDLFNKDNRLNLVENLRYFREAVVQNLHRVSLNIDTLSRDFSKETLDNETLSKKCDNVKFSDILHFYSTLEIFTNPTNTHLLTAGQLTPNTNGVIQNTRFVMATEDYNAWKATSVLSRLTSNPHKNCPIVAQLKEYEDKHWTTSKEDQIAFAKFSLLSMLYNLEYSDFPLMAVDKIPQVQKMVKSFFIAWKDKYETLNDLPTWDKFEAMSCLREALKEFALNGEYCPAGNFESIELLFNEWVLHSKSATAAPSIETALPARIVDNYREMFFTGIKFAIQQSPILNALIDVGDQHSANRLKEWLSFAGFSSLSSSSDLGLKHTSAAMNGLIQFFIESSINKINSFTENTYAARNSLFAPTRNALSASSVQTGRQCNPKLVHYWYLEQLGFLDKNSPTHPRNLTELELRAQIDPWSKFYEEVSEESLVDPTKDENLVFEIKDFVESNAIYNGWTPDNERPNSNDFEALLLPIILRDGMFVKISSEAEYQETKKNNQKDLGGLEIDDYLDKKMSEFRNRSILKNIWIFTKTAVKFVTRHTIGLLGFGLHSLWLGIKATPSYLFRAIKSIPSVILGLLKGAYEGVILLGVGLSNLIKSIIMSPLSLWKWIFSKNAPKSTTANNHKEKSSEVDQSSLLDEAPRRTLQLSKECHQTSPSIGSGLDNDGMTQEPTRRLSI